MTGLERLNMRLPPWSEQPVRRWVRVLAWIWVALFVLVLPLAVFFTWQDGGIPREYWLFTGLFALGELYFTVLLYHVATKGFAPRTWLPWT